MITKEAIEAAARAMCEAWHYSKIGTPDGDAEWGRKQDQYRTQARAAITAALAAMPGPAVKVLRWKGPDSAGEYHSLDGLWGYIIRHGNGNGVWLTEVGGYFPTAESAKAAAQADYEARILSALTPATDLASENERLRAALETIARRTSIIFGAPHSMSAREAFDIAVAALERT